MSIDVLLLFGLILLAGLSVSEGARRVKAPQVVGFILAGVIIGPTGINILPPEKVKSLIPITSFALAIIGFNIGSELQWRKIKTLGKSITLIVIFESLLAFAFVAIGIYLLTGKTEYGLIFGSLAAATAPAATVDVIYEYKAKGPLTTTLLAVVGLDDAMAIFIYAFAVSFAKTALSPEIHLTVKTILIEPLIEIIGSIGLGTVIGLLFVFIAKKIQNKIKILTLILGTLFITAGISNELNLSLILMSMAIGITVVNVSPNSSQKVTETLENFSPPIYIVFFSLVGARLNLRTITSFGTLSLMIVGLYVVLRAAGKYIGVLLGAYLSKAQEAIRKYLGFALFSQAGVAIGLAILSANQFSAISEKGKQLASLIILVITLTTFIVQIVGPPLVKYALFKAKENTRG